MDSIETIQVELPSWAGSGRSLRANDASPERVLVAECSVEGPALFDTVQGPSREGACRITDARLCNLWVCLDSFGVVVKTFRHRSEAVEFSATRSKHGASTRPLAVTRLRTNHAILCGPFLCEATVGIHISKTVLPRICPFFVEILSATRTSDHCLVLMDRCDATVSRLLPDMNDDMILTVIRQAAIAIETAKDFAKVYFDKNLPLSSLLAVDLQSELQNLRHRGRALKDNPMLACQFGDVFADFPHHDTIVKMSGYSKAQVRFRSKTPVFVGAVVKDHLEPWHICQKMLTEPGLFPGRSEVRGLVNELAKCRTYDDFFQRAFAKTWTLDPSGTVVSFLTATTSPSRQAKQTNDR